MSWLIKKLINKKTVGYLLEIARPEIEIVIDDLVKTTIVDSLHNEEIMKELIYVTDGLYERYRRKIFGTMGGLQKGLNAEQDKQTQDFDFFDKDGRLSIKKIIPIALKSNFFSSFGGNKAQNRPGTREEGSNAPKM